MEVKVSTLKNIVFTALFIIGTAVFFIVISANKPSATINTSNGTANGTTPAITTTGDTQVININAKGGYYPRAVEAKANMESTLAIITKNTFDCSSALIIPKLGIEKNLPVSGKTEFKIPPQAPGTVIEGACSMYMYTFQIKFV
jgi:plastocyanin domain-containing protein